MIPCTTFHNVRYPNDVTHARACENLIAKSILWPCAVLTGSVSAPHTASLCPLPGVDPGCMGGSMDKHDLGLS